MEAAYGLSITLAMLMTTILLAFYFRIKRKPMILLVCFLAVYMTIEVSFLIANLNKFSHGGWVTILIAGILVSIMYIWYRGYNIKKSFIEFDKINEFKQILKDLNQDNSVTKYATNLIYLTRASIPNEVESKIIYSIINKQPKRADVYWFIHLNVMDEPYRSDYKVQNLIPNILYRIDFNLGFRVQPRINLFFKRVVSEMEKNNEIDITSRYTSLRQHNIVSDFRFVVIDRIQNYDFDFSPFNQLIMDLYAFIKHFSISDVKAFGLDTSSVVVENVPFKSPRESDVHLTRIDCK